MTNSEIAWSSGDYSQPDFNDSFDEIVYHSLDEEDEFTGRKCPECHGLGQEDAWDEDSPPCFECGGEGYI